MEIPTFRARTVPEILDAAFQVLRRRYVLIAAVSLLILSPALVLELVLPPEAAGLAGTAQNFLLIFASGAVVVIVSDVYMGRETELADVLREVRSRFLSLWGAAILSGLLIGIGTLMLVIPGIIAFIVTFAMPMAVMVEGKRASDSLDRSTQLAKGHHWRILGALGLAYGLMLLAAFGAGSVLAVLPESQAALAAVLNTLIVALANPFPAVVATLMYYDLRIRKEGFDIAMLMEAPPGAAPEPVPA